MLQTLKISRKSQGINRGDIICKFIKITFENVNVPSSLYCFCTSLLIIFVVIYINQYFKHNMKDVSQNTF